MDPTRTDGRTGDNEALAVNTRVGAILVQQRALDGGVAEHWRIDDGEHVIRWVPAGFGGPTEHHVPGDSTNDPIGWFERTR